jgi:hypothetical protein
MIRIQDKSDLDPDSLWEGVLSAVRGAVCSLVHTTTRAMPTQLVFGCDTDLQYIKERKQHRILQNNKGESTTRRPHTYKPNNKVMVKLNPHFKLSGARF